MSALKPTIDVRETVTARFLKQSFLDDSGPFGAWNNPAIRAFRNCYAFACDALDPELTSFAALAAGHDDAHLLQIKIDLPHPGTTGGEPLTEISAPALKKAIIADGFIPQSSDDFTKIAIHKGYYLIAAYCNELDYHFYRYHQPSKIWFHKEGWKEVSDCDANGTTIFDPQKAHRAGYDSFVGFFLSPPTRPAMKIVAKDGAGKIIYSAPAHPQASFSF